MKNFLDMVVGGILPHVYCKKITLEKDPNNKNNTRVTLNLELYEEKNRILSHKTWLGGKTKNKISHLDAMYIQILPIYDGPDISKLYASRDPSLSSGGNAHVIHQKGTRGYLPHGPIGGKQYSANLKRSLFQKGLNLPAPLKITTDSLLGDIGSPSTLRRLIKKGRIKEEYKYNKLYYVIPFTYTYNFSRGDRNLGFAF
jgi:hypothetical protein